MIAAPVMLVGACIGAGLALVVRGALPQHPDLEDALARLRGSAVESRPSRGDDAGRIPAELQV